MSIPLFVLFAIVAIDFLTRRAERRTDGFACQHSFMSLEKL